MFNYPTSKVHSTLPRLFCFRLALFNMLSYKTVTINVINVSSSTITPTRHFNRNFRLFLTHQNFPMIVNRLFFQYRSRTSRSILFDLVRLKGNGKVRTSTSCRRPLVRSKLPNHFNIFRPRRTKRSDHGTYTSNRHIRLTILPRRLTNLTSILRKLNIVSLGTQTNRPSQLSHFYSRNKGLTLFHGSNNRIKISR